MIAIVQLLGFDYYYFLMIAANGNVSVPFAAPTIVCVAKLNINFCLREFRTRSRCVHYFVYLEIILMVSFIILLSP